MEEKFYLNMHSMLTSNINDVEYYKLGHVQIVITHSTYGNNGIILSEDIIYDVNK